MENDVSLMVTNEAGEQIGFLDPKDEEWEPEGTTGKKSISGLSSRASGPGSESESEVIYLSIYFYFTS